MPYEVMVDDNFHFMDETERYKDGEFADLTVAIERCRKIVDDYLESAYNVAKSSVFKGWYEKSLVLMNPTKAVDELEALMALYVEMTGNEPTAEELEEAKNSLGS